MGLLMSISFLLVTAGAAGGLFAVAEAAAGAMVAVSGAAGSTAVAIACVPRRRRTRLSPSRRSISLRSCSVIRATSALTVRTSKGAGSFEESSATEDSWMSIFPGTGSPLGGVDEPRLTESRFTGSKLHDVGCQVARHAGELFGPVGRHQHVVFNADAEFIGQVDARFDRHHHAGLQPCLGTRLHQRGFVHLHANAVADAVREKVAIAGVSDHRPGRRVDLLHLDAGTHRREGRALRSQYNFIYSFDFRIRPPACATSR